MMNPEGHTPCAIFLLFLILLALIQCIKNVTLQKTANIFHISGRDLSLGSLVCSDASHDTILHLIFKMSLEKRGSSPALETEGVSQYKLCSTCLESALKGPDEMHLLIYLWVLVTFDERFPVLLAGERLLLANERDAPLLQTLDQGLKFFSCRVCTDKLKAISKGQEVGDWC